MANHSSSIVLNAIPDCQSGADMDITANVTSIKSLQAQQDSNSLR